MGGHYYLGKATSIGARTCSISSDGSITIRRLPIASAYDVPLIDRTSRESRRRAFRPGPHSERAERIPWPTLAAARWYAISVNKMHDRGRAFDIFLRFKPVGMPVYSITSRHQTR